MNQEMSTRHIILVGDSMGIKQELMALLSGSKDNDPPVKITKTIQRGVSVTVWNAVKRKCFKDQTAQYAKMFNLGILVLDLAKNITEQEISEWETLLTARSVPVRIIGCTKANKKARKQSVTFANALATEKGTTFKQLLNLSEVNELIKEVTRGPYSNRKYQQMTDIRRFQSNTLPNGFRGEAKNRQSDQHSPVQPGLDIRLLPSHDKRFVPSLQGSLSKENDRLKTQLQMERKDNAATKQELRIRERRLVEDLNHKNKQFQVLKIQHNGALMEKEQAITYYRTEARFLNEENRRLKEENLLQKEGNQLLKEELERNRKYLQDSRQKQEQMYDSSSDD